MTYYALLAGNDLDAPLAWRRGQALSRRRFLADVARLQQLLPPDPASGPMLNLTADRYQFAVGLGAALLHGHCSVLPPNHTPDMLQRLQGHYAQGYSLIPADSPSLQLAWPVVACPDFVESSLWLGKEVPEVNANALVAEVLTSGSTGTPVAHAKHWGLLVRNTQVGAERLAQHMGRANLQGVTLVATVPPQHMYGLESTVLVALLGGAAFDTERPFYAADIARALAGAPRPRMLVTTPFHLRMLIESQIALPPIDLALCATAPLTQQWALRAEAALSAPLMEIYGCTETGQVATRRTTEGPEWHAFQGLTLSTQGDKVWVQGGHVPEPTALADVLELTSPQRFRLLGRSNDLINMAGKRSSLSHLNYHLNSVPGVHDGSFWQPTGESDDGVTRLVAFVVAPQLSADKLHEHVVAALRGCIDPVFLPRRIVAVPALPREATGKLTAAALEQWALKMLAPTTVVDHHVDVQVRPDHPAFAGHFPGNPILPGVVLLAEICEAALAEPTLAALLGTSPQLGAVKFSAPVRPASLLRLHLRHTPKAAHNTVRFEAWCGEQLAASGHFESVLPA